VAFTGRAGFPQAAGWSRANKTLGTATLPHDFSAVGEGILPDAAISALAQAGGIRPAVAFAEDQIQPASLDLRLGKVAYRVRASFLPGPNATVAERIAQIKLHEIDLTEGAVLETGCVYIVPLLESLDLPAAVSASANPKSSTGRMCLRASSPITRAASIASRPAIAGRFMPKSAHAPFRCWSGRDRACRRSASAAGIRC
jgi:hypothetical protein